MLLLTAVFLLTSIPQLAEASEPLMTIDHENVYEGMDRAYRDGYAPLVQEGHAVIVLPLHSNRPLKENTITVTPYLGDTSTSPFVYRNYQKTVVLAQNPANGTEAAEASYLVRFDLALKQDRRNGAFPVTITVRGRTEENLWFEESFTTYVTVTDGQDAEGAQETAVRPVNLTLDSTNLYEGMDKTYSQGYSPIVANGVATLILPVLADGYLKGSTLTAVPDLGDTARSPFVFKSYQKEAALTPTPVNNGEKKVSAYYIRFELSLAENRFNGIYPVVVTVQGRNEKNEAVIKTFTVFITITDGKDPNAVTEPEKEEPVQLSLDSQNLYPEMDSTYSQGYTPVIQGDTAVLILPVLSDGPLKNNTVTAVLSLGDTASSPFEYRAYRKEVALSEVQVNVSELSVSTYFVRFDLQLLKERFNGVYPVVVSILGQTLEGDRVEEAFTVYVTVSDGKNPNEEEPPEIPVSQPLVLVKKYTITPKTINAGDEWKVLLTLQNTSNALAVQNMTVEVQWDRANMTLINDTNVLYIERLNKGESVDLSLSFKTDGKTPAGRYTLDLAMTYDNPEAQTLSSTGTLTVEISQPAVVELEGPAIPDSVVSGETLPLSFNVMNMSRERVYNVRIRLAAPGFVPLASAFLGNMEAGSAKQGEMDVFIAVLEGETGVSEESKYGITNGTITLSYEDAAGKAYEQTSDFISRIDPSPAPVKAPPAGEPERAGQWWVSIALGGGVIIGLSFIFVKRNRKKELLYENQ